MTLSMIHIKTDPGTATVRVIPVCQCTVHPPINQRRDRWEEPLLRVVRGDKSCGGFSRHVTRSLVVPLSPSVSICGFAHISQIIPCRFLCKVKGRQCLPFVVDVV